MIRYIRRDAETLDDAQWNEFFTNYNNNIIKGKIDDTNPKLIKLKAFANEVGQPIVTTFNISGPRLVVTPNFETFAGDAEAHNNAITEIPVLNYLINIHYIGMMFPLNPAATDKKRNHGTNIFLSWHRMFLLEFEEFLGSPSHYWNWYDNQDVPVKMQATNLKEVIKDGATKFYKDLNRKSESIIEGSSAIANSKAEFQELFTNSWKSLYDSSRIDSFTKISRHIEGSLHNNMHNAIGGDSMSNPIFSPHDPIFWFHHSFVDKIWADFYNTLSDDEKDAITDYPDNEMPFFDKKANEIKDIKLDQKISYHGLLKDRSLVSNPSL